MITQENIPYTADEIKAMVKTCEKYNKAREKARELMDKGYDVLMPEIFPELNENEDEKIKREIVAYINELADLKNEKIPTKWLDWLEKQGEQKPVDKVEPKFKLRDWIVDAVSNGEYSTRR